MPKSTDARTALTGDELAEQSGAPLPEREAMSTIDASGVDNFAAPINEALALNVNSTQSYAIADADQVVILNQIDVDGPDNVDDNDGHPRKDK